MLSQAEVDSFVAEGFVAVRDAVPADVRRACLEEIWSALADLGGRHPRIIAQPGVALHDAFPLVQPLSPVELAITADN
jgi:hypothetical protein